jgi:hypothetical protein
MPVLQPVMTAVGCPAAAEARTAQPRLALAWLLLLLLQQLWALYARCSCICLHPSVLLSHGTPLC